MPQINIPQINIPTAGAVDTPAVQAVDTPAVQAVDTPAVQAVNEVPAVDTPAVQAVGGEVSTDNKPKKLSRTAKWEQLEPMVNKLLAGDTSGLNEFIAKVVEFYKPKSGGGSAQKDWSRRVEDVLGKVVAKRDQYTGLWYINDEDNHKNSAFSKNKYVTKRLLKVIRDAEEKAQGIVSANMLAGKLTEDKNVLALFNPNSTEQEKFDAVLALYPDEVAKVAQDYSAEGKYLGQSQAEAVQTLEGLGYQGLKTSD